MNSSETIEDVGSAKVSQKDIEKERRILENQMSILRMRREPIQIRVQRVTPELLVNQPSSATLNTYNYRILGDYSAAKKRHMSFRIGDAPQSQMIVKQNSSVRRKSEIIKKLNEESIMEQQERECKSNWDNSNEARIIEQIRNNVVPNLQLSRDRDRGYKFKRHTTHNIGCNSLVVKGNNRGDASIEPGQLILQTFPEFEQEVFDANSLPDPSLVRHAHSFADMSPQLEIQNIHDFNNIQLSPISERDRDNGQYIGGNQLIIVPQQVRTSIPPELQSENMALARQQAEEQQEHAARLSSMGDIEMEEDLQEVRRHK